MSSSDPSANGGVPPKPNPLGGEFESVDPLELNLEDIPTVEAVEEFAPVKRRKPGFGIIKALLWCLLFLLVTQVLPAVAILAPLLLEKFPQLKDKLAVDEFLKSNELKQATQAAILTAPVCGALFSILMLRLVVGRNWKRRIALRLPHIEHVVLVIMLALPFMIFNMALESVLSPIFRNNLGGRELEEFMREMQTWPIWILVLGISVGPAISEELWCRGFLGQGLANRYGMWGGVLATSFLFGLIHMNPLQSTMAVLMGIALHLVYLATRSILIPMLLHFLNNAIAILAEVPDSPLPIGKSLEHALEHSPALTLLAAFFFAVVIATAFYQSRVRIEPADGADLPRAVRCHVEIPDESSGFRAVSRPFSALATGLLVTSSCFFAAIWFGI